MLTLLIAFATSFLLGLRHATDPDHLVAISTIVSRERSVTRAAAIGGWWGLGHTLTIFVVGGAIILFKMRFTPRIGLSLEFAVAIMLIVLGVLNLAGSRDAAAKPQAMRPFLVGLVHGLAGSAAATLLIVPLIGDPRWAMLYLVVFGIGTIGGMGLATVAIAAPAAYATARVGQMERGIRVASGALSLAFGVYLALKIGFVDGLFGARPTWIPG